MPVRFNCTSCDTRIRVPDGAEGKRVRCPKCGHRHRVPGQKKEATPAAKPVLDPPPPPKASEPDEVSLSDDPINRPKRGKKRKRHYVPKVANEQRPGDAVIVGPDGQPIAGDEPPPEELPSGDDSDLETEDKPAGESVADLQEPAQADESTADQPDEPQRDEQTSEDSESEDRGEPLLTLDEQPEGMMDSDGEDEVAAAISSPESIDQEIEPSPELSAASAVPSPAVSEDEPVEEDDQVTEEAPAPEPRTVEPTRRKTRSISLSKAPPPVEESDDLDDSDGLDEPPPLPSDDSSIDEDFPEIGDELEDEPPPAPKPAAAAIPRQIQQLASAVASAPTPMPTAAPPPRPAKPAPAFTGLLLVAWCLRAFALLIFIGAGVLSPWALGSSSPIAMIMLGIGAALVCWGLGEAAAALRQIARNSFR